MIEELEQVQNEREMPKWAEGMNRQHFETRLAMIIKHVNEEGQATQESTGIAFGYKISWAGGYLNEGVLRGHLSRREGRPIIYKPSLIRPVKEVVDHDSGVIESLTLYLDANKLRMLKSLCAYRFGSTYIGGQKTVLGKLIDEEYLRLEAKGIPIREFLETALKAEADYERLRRVGADTQSDPDQA